MLAIALAVFGSVTYNGISRLGDDFIRIAAPGEHDMPLESGTYTVFHEHVPSPRGRVDAGAIDGLEITVHPHDGGAAVLLTADRTNRYNLGSRSGESLFRFTIEGTGDYRIATRFADGRSASETRLALARDFVGTLLGIIFTGVAIGLGGVVLSAGIAFMTWRRRRAAAR